MKALIKAMAAFAIAGCTTIANVITNDSSTTPLASTTWQRQAGSMVVGTDTINWTYYIVGPPGTKPLSIVWWLHGFGDYQDLWAHPTLLGTSYQALEQILPVGTAIVTVSWSALVSASLNFYSGWLLTGYPSRVDVPVSATYANFANVVMPALEAQLSLPPPPYVLAGHSQGGFNAAQLFTHYPALWSRAAFINGMFTTIGTSCFGTISGEDACLLVGGANILIPGSTDTYFFFHANYDSQAEYGPDQPSAALALMSPVPTAKVYATGCMSDMFGLYEADQQFAQAMHVMRIQTVFETLPPNCDHFDFGAQELSIFLTTGSMPTAATIESGAVITPL
jgi:pimeloyl-ACP methyl ester carboxylesterase